MDEPVRVIDLSKAPGEREAWDRPRWVVYLWALCELVFVTNPFQISSGLRVRVLRRFGAKIGEGVIMRPRLRVKFPWKLSVGARSWIGEGVWIHNQGRIEIGSDVVVSQESFLTTGTHAFRTDMALETLPVVIEDGVWITSRCMVLAGSRIRRSALILPNTVVRGEVPAGTLFGTPSGQVVGQRFDDRLARGSSEAPPLSSPSTQAP
jgi:putative colanic acid biosynthesis acetyltransferase WcaF